MNLSLEQRMAQGARHLRLTMPHNKVRNYERMRRQARQMATSEEEYENCIDAICRELRM